MVAFRDGSMDKKRLPGFSEDYSRTWTQSVDKCIFQRTFCCGLAGVSERGCSPESLTRGERCSWKMEVLTLPRRRLYHVAIWPHITHKDSYYSSRSFLLLYLFFVLLWEWETPFCSRARVTFSFFGLSVPATSQIKLRSCRC